MILPYDPFGKNRMIYTIKTSCIEYSSIPYEDGSTAIYLYTKGTEGNPSQELQNMVHYVEHSNIDHVSDNTLKTMHEFVETVKYNKDVMKRYMKSWEYEEMIREEATKEGLEKGRTAIAKNLLGLLNIETIAAKTGLTVDEVKKLETDK